MKCQIKGGRTQGGRTQGGRTQGGRTQGGRNQGGLRPMQPPHPTRHTTMAFWQLIQCAPYPMCALLLFFIVIFDIFY